MQTHDICIIRFLGHHEWVFIHVYTYVLFIVNLYIIYKTPCEEGKVNTMSHYEFWRLVCLAKIDPTNFGGRDHLVSAVQRQGIRKNHGSTTPSTAVSARRGIEKKRQYRKRKMDKGMSACNKKKYIKEGLGNESI